MGLRFFGIEPVGCVVVMFIVFALVFRANFGVLYSVLWCRGVFWYVWGVVRVLRGPWDVVLML